MPVGRIYLSLADISTTSFLSHGFTIYDRVRTRVGFMRVIAKSPRWKKEEKKRHLVREPAISSAEKKQTLERSSASALSPPGHNFIARISDIASNSLKSVIERKSWMFHLNIRAAVRTEAVEGGGGGGKLCNQLL